MNPLDATIIRLGIYIGQLEQQVQELHKQLVEATQVADRLKGAYADTVVPIPEEKGE